MSTSAIDVSTIKLNSEKIISVVGAHRNVSQGSGASSAGDEKRTLCLTEECVRTASSLLSAMDQAIDPCTDFFQYACGTWNRMHVIPEDKSSISTFEVMADQLQVVLKGLLEDPINLRDNDATRKAKLFYNSCTNLSDIRKVGDKPIRQIIAQLGGWPVLNSNWTAPSFSVETLLGIIRSNYNEGYVIEQWVGPDDKNSSNNILQVICIIFVLPFIVEMLG
ncbi:unnamed protein product [Acanthoscelides obtectus]|uniref:Peptidase M13 N-terminal domain-containing protein n=1 Tax=Acanthoscelides obtectus TaxID=200917 RepID=A0A9P0KTY2_ACAOB|nr:unnamed protein product [Acanthoscelides obtectus]CAK1651203.1 Neprilysin-1 [Acanthoscelides obtectus]